jgi:hypothetical protein
VFKTASAEGARTAPKAPCAARAAISIVKPPAAPATAEAAANPVTPIKNVVLRPIRSAIRPPSSSRLPNAREYAVMTHCRSALENPRARCAVGRGDVHDGGVEDHHQLADPGRGQDPPAVPARRGG